MRISEKSTQAITIPNTQISKSKHNKKKCLPAWQHCDGDISLYVRKVHLRRKDLQFSTVRCLRLPFHIHLHSNVRVRQGQICSSARKRGFVELPFWMLILSWLNSSANFKYMTHQCLKVFETILESPSDTFRSCRLTVF